MLHWLLMITAVHIYMDIAILAQGGSMLYVWGLNTASALPVVAHGAVAPDGQGDQKAFRLRGNCCLFTYNSIEFANMEKNHLWTNFLTWLATLSFLSRWSATMERSTHSADSSRLHLHVFMEFLYAVDWTTLAKVVYLNVHPNAKPTTARGDNQREVMDQGHFYVWADKVGTVFVKTSGYEPWVHYVVKGWWIDQLWTQHKLARSVYVEYAAKVRLGFLTRLRQAEAVVEREKLALLQEKQRIVATRLAPLRKNFRMEVVQRLVPWAEQYQLDLERFKFLVLRGGSRAGKSTLGKSMDKLFQFGLPYVQTVQNAETAALKGFDPENHGYIVFDNVNNMKFILDQRALFQANNDIHTLGESKTGIYSYMVWLYRVPIVVTVDLSAKWDSEEPWIRENMCEVFLDGPCYY